MTDKKDFLLEEIRDLRKELIRMNEILAENTESLRTHMRRTELLEEVSAKLSAEQVAKIKTLSQNGFDDSEIAAAVKVNLYDVKAVLAEELI